MRKLLLILPLVASLGVAQAGDVYMTRDAQGNPHYSDKPIEGAELVSTGKPRPPTPPAAEAARKATAQSQLAASNARISEQQAAANTAKTVQQDVADVRQKQCAEAKTRYEKSIQARRLYKELANGEREYLSDADADAMRVSNKQVMDEACGAAAR